MKQLLLHLWMMLLLCGAAVPVWGQVAPSEISTRMLRESVEAVLGTENEPEWIEVDLSAVDVGSLELHQKNRLPDTLFIGRVESGEGVRWIVPDIAPSRSELFSFLLYLDAHLEIIDVDVLEYRENYGHEIDYPVFRRQFRGMNEPGDIRYGRSIQNISGATISTRSLTYAVHDLMTILQQIELPE